MCVDFDPPTRADLSEYFGVEPPDFEWKPETWQDYAAPIIVSEGGNRRSLIGTYGFVPKDKMPPNVRLTTMNARAETVGELKTYKKAWATSHLCLVPMRGFYEPNYESGKAVRWRIHLTDERPFAVAGIWRSWPVEDGPYRHSFSQLTVNADSHPFMSRFHKPGDEKRSLVVVPEVSWDDWLNCSNPEYARAFMQLYPADLMAGEERPLPPRIRKEAQQTLF